MKTISAIAAILLSAGAFAQERVVRTINEAWEFSFPGTAKSETVNLPHTWNNLDILDEEPGFNRLQCTYEKILCINDDLDGKESFIRFEGANQITELFVNGASAGVHTGGYTAFTFNVTSLLKQGENEIKVLVDNSHNTDIPPLSADFCFYGGIYRDVELIITGRRHVSLGHFGSNGIYITTPSVSTELSKVCVRTLLTNSLDVQDRVSVEHTVFTPSGEVASSVSGRVRLEPSAVNQEVVQELSVRDCRLWDVENPELYRLVTVLKDRNGNMLDKVENTFGLRTFSFDVSEGFNLNGRKVKLIGTNRHQDYCRMGNALPDEMHVRDMKLLKDMGGNFIRISHYPQDPVVPSMCDRLGLLSSIEIPIVNEVTDSPEFNGNSLNMLREMIYQNFNHPSVIIWAYMNEIQHHAPFSRYSTPKERQLEFFKPVPVLARMLNDECKAVDPDRYTMLVICDDPTRIYKWTGVGDVPDVLGMNLYSGWYSGTVEGFATKIGELEELFPDKPLILTEYGVGVDPRIHSRKPVRFDFSAEYGRRFHSSYIRMIADDPRLAGSTVWNLNDFYSEFRVDAVPHVNNKGLVGLDRVKKDSYLLYQAYLSRKPYLRIGGRDWLVRGGVEGQLNHVEVFSNAGQVSLSVNGRPCGTAEVKGNVAVFDVPFEAGENYISATDGTLEDALRIDFREVPSDMSEFTEMNVMLGSDRYFEDRPSSSVWIPEQEYVPGSWGYVGGGRLCTGTWNRVPLSCVDVLGTENDPVFQTQRVGLEAFRADVPDGQYYVYLYFAEVADVSEEGKLCFYAGEPREENKVVCNEREFSVRINGTTVLQDFNMVRQYGAGRAVIKKFTVMVEDGKGLEISFVPGKGLPALNAVRIFKNM